MIDVFKMEVSRRAQLSRLADGLVVAVAFSLPWSTSATSILIALWGIVLLPTLDVAALRREIQTPAGGLPVLLFLLGVIGMAWASVPMGERLHGAQSFIRLLAIPLLMLQFRNSRRGNKVLIAFFASCILLLVASCVLAMWPHLMPGHSVPVKTYIVQSAEFTICAFALFYLAGESWKTGNIRRCLLLTLLSLPFLFDIFYIATSKTTLVVFPVILLVWAGRQFGIKGAAFAVGAGILAVAVIWVSSPYLRSRVNDAVTDVQRYEKENAATSVGERLEWGKKSIRFLVEAPVIGHGIGSIREQFRGAVVGTSGVSAELPDNPHNQTFLVAIQLGLLGVTVLWAMWVSHLLLFRKPGVIEWFGLLIVLQHVGGSISHSYLFDFTEGWLYVFGVGVLGGMVRRRAS